MIPGPRFTRLIAALLALGALVWGGTRLADRHPDWNAPISTSQRYSHASFEEWLTGQPGRRSDFQAFERFLAEQGVSGVVPDWQLLRTDLNDRIGCPRPAFLLPPRENWQKIVPALRLVRDQVVPAIGKVEVVSSYRSAAFNACVGGAGQSRHLGFAAVDLVALAEIDNRDLFTRLCALHRKLGPASRFGLGAYFDPAREGRNRRGRFHVDATGYRSWGFSKKSGSSGCRLLGTG